MRAGCLFEHPSRDLARQARRRIDVKELFAADPKSTEDTDPLPVEGVPAIVNNRRGRFVC